MDDQSKGETVIEIARIGGHGDGLAQAADGRPIFVPLTAPGDRVRVRLRSARGGGHMGEALELLASGPGRQEPVCAHFGRCGGCRLQHLDETLYRDWKRGRVRDAVARSGFDPALVEPLRPAAPGSRRRVELAAVRRRDGLVLGFRERASHRVFQLEMCAVAHPAIVAAVPELRRALADVLAPGPPAGIAITETETGLDALIAWDRDPDLSASQRLADMAHALGLARLTWHTEGTSAQPLVIRAAPTALFSDVAVRLPPAAFLQPTAAGERALVEAVTRALPAQVGPMADLYAGCGTFTFALARRGPVHAVEADSAALAALNDGARASGLWGTVTSEARDLDRNPLSAKDLGRFAAVLFDPPRAGAAAQVETLARSAVPTVLAVSCNPASFARDARTLREGGYRLETVVPVDQFLWSQHVELAAVFRRG